jgi:NodT family efflux transporter outer membrane factor (OMF) lipoprotein
MADNRAMKPNAPVPLVLSWSVAILLSGCAVGPDFHKPEAPSGAGFTVQPLPQTTSSAPGLAGDAQRFVSGETVPFDWWKAFDSPALDSLVEEALKANPSIPAARAALAQAQELVYAQQGYFFPTIGAQYQFERQKLSGNTGGNSPGVQGNGTVISTGSTTAGPPYVTPIIYNFHTAELTVGYTPDVFGLNRRQVESLDAQAQYQRFELEATYVTLVSNVVGAAIQEASLRAQIAATQAIIADNQKSLDILRDKLENGYAMRLDVAAQEAALGQAQQLLPPLTKQLEQTRDLIRVLVGKLPNEEVAETFELSALKLPGEVPLTLPSMVIEQRPDVRAAEQQLRAANAQVGVALANRLPQFSIQGAVGGNASNFSQMFASGGPFWDVIGSVSQTIFAGNTLLHEQRAAQQAFLQSAALYRQTVLAAYQDVADTLHMMLADADALGAAVATERAAKMERDLTLSRREAGYTDYLTYLTAELTYQQAVLGLAQAQALRFGDTAALYQALGGGWQDRPQNPP